MCYQLTVRVSKSVAIARQLAYCICCVVVAAYSPIAIEPSDRLGFAGLSPPFSQPTGDLTDQNLNSNHSTRVTGLLAATSILS